ncbi:hypothetical protein J6590_002219, partial [Homalodisca vitripennis]
VPELKPMDRGIKELEHSTQQDGSGRAARRDDKSSWLSTSVSSTKWNKYSTYELNWANQAIEAIVAGLPAYGHLARGVRREVYGLYITLTYLGASYIHCSSACQIWPPITVHTIS